MPPENRTGDKIILNELPLGMLNFESMYVFIKYLLYTSLSNKYKHKS